MKAILYLSRAQIMAILTALLLKRKRDFFKWLNECAGRNVNICSVCTGAFILGQAGLLDGIECTTHWRRIPELRQRFPKAKVIEDVLFVKSKNIYTSAGISAGIDLALSILEDLKGPFFTHKVARGLVVYHRRSHRHKQESIYLDYRNHINPQVHAVQDYLIDHLSAKTALKCWLNSLP
jgi:transcriptional regulator GlxA family with amidase domain